MNNRNVVIEAGMKTAFGVIQGGGLGYLMGTFMESSAKTLNAQGGNASSMVAQMQAAGGGAAFTVASGNYSVPAVLNSALLLGLVTGGFYKVRPALQLDPLLFS